MAVEDGEISEDAVTGRGIAAEDVTLCRTPLPTACRAKTEAGLWSVNAGGKGCPPVVVLDDRRRTRPD